MVAQPLCLCKSLRQYALTNGHAYTMTQSSHLCLQRASQLTGPFTPACIISKRWWSSSGAAAKCRTTPTPALAQSSWCGLINRKITRHKRRYTGPMPPTQPLINPTKVAARTNVLWCRATQQAALWASLHELEVLDSLLLLAIARALYLGAGDTKCGWAARGQWSH
jgi:hypothetical protein